MDFIDIPKNLPAGENMGGLIQKVFFAYHADVLTWPTKPIAPATVEENGVLTGELAMVTGKRFFEMYITDDSGELTFESVGEKDGKSFVVHLSFFHPGLQKKLLGFMNAAKNENLVLVAVDNNGQQFILGDQYRPATFEAAPDGSGTGKETASRRGISLEFTYKTANIYTYEGSVPLTPAA
jgi:hypothetical protein